MSVRAQETGPVPTPTSSVSHNRVTATGSTTARSLKDRFSDVVNVKDYGAVGDGVADDTEEIQAAIGAAASGARRVVVPYTGNPYLISSALTLTTGVSIVGDGPRPRIQQTNAAANVITINANDADASRRTFHLENLYLFGGTNGLHITGAQYIARFSRFVQIDFYNQSSAAIRIDNAGVIGTHWSGVNIEGPAPQYGIISQGYQLLNGSAWYNVRVKGATVEAWHIEDTTAGSTTQVSIYSPIIESNAGKGIVVKRAAVSLYDPWFEGNGSVTGGADIDLDGADVRTEMSIFDGYFTSAGAAQSNRRIFFSGASVYLRLFATRFKPSPSDVIDGNNQTSGSRILMAHLAAKPTVSNFSAPVAYLDHDAVRMPVSAASGAALVKGSGTQTDDGNALGVKIETGQALTNGSALIADFKNNDLHKAGIDINGNAKFSGDKVTLGVPGSTGSNVYATNVLSELGTTASLHARGQQADAAGSVGVKLGNTTALTTAGARVVAVYSDNLATEVASVRKSATAWGVRLQSPDGTWYLLTIANGGTVTVTANP